MEINGIAHIQVTVNDLDQAKPFYEKVCGFMGMQTAIKSDYLLYMIGGRTAIAISQSTVNNRDCTFDQFRVGLHHVCFRARSRADVDELFEFLQREGITIVHPPEEGPWAHGYYSVLFEDPDGIRLEVNYVPGRGHFETPEKLPLDSPPGYEDYPT